MNVTYDGGSDYGSENSGSASDIFWHCGVCHEKRLDWFISVLSYPLIMTNLLGEKEKFKGMTVNLKYCKDNILCMMGALEKSFKGEP